MADNVVPLHQSDTAPLVTVGRAVVARLDDAIPLMGQAYRREVAEYAAMTKDQFDHVLLTSRAFIGEFAQRLADGQAHPVPDHHRLVAAGRRRQEDGISLDAAMHAFRIASRVGWTSIADATEEVGAHLVGDLAALWIEYVDRAATAFAEGHATASTEQLRRVDARKQAFVTDLLAAEDATTARTVAARHGLAPAATYTPVVVCGPDAYEHLGRVATALPAALLGHRAQRIVALLPDLPAPDRRLDELARRFVVVVGRPVEAGGALLTEVADLESTAAAAQARGMTAGRFGTSDLLLDRVVREHAQLRHHLVDAVLDRIAAADRDGVFLETLAAYAETGSVPDTAARLFVHANTVTYRLRRIRDITGLDPRVPADAAVLVLALTLHGELS